MKFPRINVNGILSKVYNKTRGKAPDILFGLGAAGVVGGTVMACKATLELPAIIEDYRKEKTDIMTAAEDEKDQKKAVRGLRRKTAGKIVKLYAPAALVEGLSITGMKTSNNMLKVVNTELSVTCLGLSQALDKYRAAVREECGEEAEERIAYGGYDEKEVVSENADGTEVKETVRVYKRDCGMPSPYARWFVYGEAEAAEKSDTYNRNFLKNQENLINIYFRAHKRVYLNDLYQLLGIKPSVTGNRVGWIYDPAAPEGDNHILLRTREVYRYKDDGSGEWEIAFLIDPNVDGCIDEKAVRLGLMDE